MWTNEALVTCGHSPALLGPREHPSVTSVFSFLSTLGSKWGRSVLPTPRCCGEPFKFLFIGSDEERVSFVPSVWFPSCLEPVGGNSKRSGWMGSRPLKCSALEHCRSEQKLAPLLPVKGTLTSLVPLEGCPDNREMYTQQS